MLNIRHYHRAKSLEEAYTLNQNKSNRILGGMLWLRLSSGNVNTAIDLCELGLDTIEETDEEFSVGAMVTLRQLEQHPGLNRYAQNAVRHAVQNIVGVQFRNLATVGGSIWGRFGFSDVLTVFMAMDAEVELYKAGRVPLAQFAAMPYDRDLLVRLVVKKTPAQFVYTSMRNQRTDFPVLACAVSRVGQQYRVTIGARPDRAVLLCDEQNLLAGGITEQSAAAFADWAAQTVRTGSNNRASAEYRTHLVRVLTRRALLELGGVE